MADLPIVKANMVPATWRVECPVCGGDVDVPEVEDDDAGIWHARADHCVVDCEECGAAIAVEGCIVLPTSDPPWRNRGHDG